MDKEPMKTENMEKPEEVVDEITSILDSLHKKVVKSSVSLGYARDAIKTTRAIWERLGNSNAPNEEAASLYNTNLQYLMSLRDEVRFYDGLTSPVLNVLNSTAGTVTSFVTASGSTDAFFGNADENATQCYPIYHSPEQNALYTEKFSAFDTAIGKTYQEIWETLYGTQADPERSALFMIRQSFDQLFYKLAPDDEVRQSVYWKSKDGDRPDQVWRIERVQYAASVHIKDAAKIPTILASSKHMLNVYDALNYAHDRNEINREKARSALEEMRAFLEEWANAIGL